MATDTEIDDEVNRLMERKDVLEKEITQTDTIDRSLQDMGTFYKKITMKLSDDSICFMCKKKLEDKEEFDIIEVPHKKVDKGLVVFAAVCKPCNTEK